MLVKVNAFPEHIHVSTVHMTQSTFVQGGPERSIIIYVHRPANLHRFVWPIPFHLSSMVRIAILRLLATAKITVNVMRQHQLHRASPRFHFQLPQWSKHCITKTANPPSPSR